MSADQVANALYSRSFSRIKTNDKGKLVVGSSATLRPTYYEKATVSPNDVFMVIRYQHKKKDGVTETVTKYLLGDINQIARYILTKVDGANDEEKRATASRVVKEAQSRRGVTYFDSSNINSAVVQRMVEMRKSKNQNKPVDFHSQFTVAQLPYLKQAVNKQKTVLVVTKVDKVDHYSLEGSKTERVGAEGGSKAKADTVSRMDDFLARLGQVAHDFEKAIYIKNGEKGVSMSKAQAKTEFEAPKAMSKFYIPTIDGHRIKIKVANNAAGVAGGFLDELHNYASNIQNTGAHVADVVAKSNSRNDKNKINASDLELGLRLARNAKFGHNALSNPQGKKPPVSPKKGKKPKSAKKVEQATSPIGQPAMADMTFASPAEFKTAPTSAGGFDFGVSPAARPPSASPLDFTSPAAERQSSPSPLDFDLEQPAARPPSAGTFDFNTPSLVPKSSAAPETSLEDLFV